MAEKVKKETKTEKKEEHKSASATEKSLPTAKPKEKKKFIPYVKKENKKKSKEAYEAMKNLKKKKHHPVFRGRFGKKNIRRKSIAKWDKWRVPHGIDLDVGIYHGFRPGVGYRSEKSTRHIHPSGYKEVLVCNMNDLMKINSKVEAARISATLGKRKRNEIMTKANEKGIWVLN
jgi:large subunit ribosomal protein L32e